MRLDFFTIWGNAVNHTDEIVEIIRSDSNFNIIYEKEFIFENYDFIEKIYGCDTVPIEHLKSKCKYLFSFDKRIYFILVENLNPKEKIVGKGEYSHIQCMKINEIKILIRNKFNQKIKNKRIRIAPLDFGVSHNHVVHASDYESQVDYVLKFLINRDISYFKGFSNKIDIKHILRGIPRRYVVIRKKEYFPNYKKGEDIDILCENIGMSIGHIYLNISNYNVSTGKEHLHIDCIDDGLDLRFDLIKKLEYPTLHEKIVKDIFDTAIEVDGIMFPREDFDLALRYFEWHKHNHKTWHLEACKNGGFESVVENYLASISGETDISSLRAKLVTPERECEVVKLEHTPHYKYLCGNKSAYKRYLTYANQPDHSVENFDKLIDEFDINNVGELECEKVRDKYVIHDGLHRACIIFFKGIDKVKIKYVENILKP